MTAKIYKSKPFSRFSKKEKIDDEDLIKAISELEQGLHDGALGGEVYKKRIARKDQGKRGSYRTIILFKKGKRAFFAYGFPKNEKANITDAEQDQFKVLADTLLKLSDKDLAKLVKDGKYTEVIKNDEEV